ncbi:MAG: TAXI family TRAP transporter solute-binding subunit [Bacteroidota bacterium]
MVTRRLLMWILVVLVLCFTGTGTFAETRLTFGSSNPGGVWYTMVGGLTTLLTEKIPGITVTLLSTGGSVENIRRLRMGDMDMAFVHASHTYQSWHGTDMFEGKPNMDIAGVCQAYASPHYFVTLKKSGIKSMSDLAGKRVLLGPPASGSAYNSKLALDLLGIKVKEVYLSYSEMCSQMKDGHIDALGMSGAPADGIVELAATEDIYVIPFTPEEIKKITDTAPYFQGGALKANVYRGQTEPVPTFQFVVSWIVRRELPEDLVYRMVKTAFLPESRKYLESVNPTWSEMAPNLENFKQLGIPIHPGAVRFWREQGVKIPQYEIKH